MANGRITLGYHRYKKDEFYYYNLDMPHYILTVKLYFFSPRTLCNACFSTASILTLIAMSVHLLISLESLDCLCVLSSLECLCVWL